MSNRDFMPNKDSDFNEWSGDFFTYLNLNRERFGISEALIVALVFFKTVWDDKYAIAESPVSRTKATVREKNEARFTLEQHLREFIREYLSFNHNVTDADRDNGSSSKAKPAGVHGVEIRWMFLEHPPVSVNELANSAFDTGTPFTLNFDESDRGKTVYFCLRWENSKGEKGPWGEIVSAIIP
jgi:hypothetical protein